MDSEVIFDAETNTGLDEALDDILARVGKWSEDIYEFEEKEYFKTRWIQLEQGQEVQSGSRMHLFFLDEHQYLCSFQGDIIFKGQWQALNDSNALILHKTINKQITQSEIFDLIFLNEDFFILKKHGSSPNKGKEKYLMLANEESVQGLSWEEILNLLDTGETSMRNTIVVVLIILLAIAFLIYQFL